MPTITEVHINNILKRMSETNPQEITKTSHLVRKNKELWNKLLKESAKYCVRGMGRFIADGVPAVMQAHLIAEAVLFYIIGFGEGYQQAVDETLKKQT